MVLNSYQILIFIICFYEIVLIFAGIHLSVTYGVTASQALFQTVFFPVFM